MEAGTSISMMEVVLKISMMETGSTITMREPGGTLVKFRHFSVHDPSSMPPDVAQAFTRMSLFLEDAPGQENPSGECSSTKDPSSEVDGMSSGTSQSIASASTPQQPTTIRIEPLHTAPDRPIEPTASTTSVGQPLATDLGPPEWTTYEDAVYKILEMKEDLVRVCIRYDGLKLVNAADHLESALISGLEVLRNGKRILPKSKRDGQPHIYFSSSLSKNALEDALEIKARIEAHDSDDD
ncbi:hypothetical protein H4Q26_009453 [Puccinia striiformis f. sp. tritici PST-130]|nr:hypothetical protein H4Q26_009453 [Puccinia striiformis f. sp. tritici PST-130]